MTDPNVIRAVRWAPAGDAVTIVDQRRLPSELVERELRTLDDVRDAIRTLAVRGAPAIGVAGAMGLVVSLLPHAAEAPSAFRERVAAHAAAIRGARPTAVNLPWAIDRMLARVAAVEGEALAGAPGGPPQVEVYGAPSDDAESEVARAYISRARQENRALLSAMRAEADAILEEDRAMCRRIGEHGLPLVRDGARVLTHCNAGALATAGIGTALAPLYLAVGAGRRVEVYADETRPLLQGSRLTAWELARAGIPVTVLADNMAASLMRAGRVDLCIVGADRIAANGDVANKVGTYALAVLARHHGIPFYVAAPASTFDPGTPTGDAIVIEQRAAEEVSRGFGAPTAPDEAQVYNPAFDVTPAELVTAFVTDWGVLRPPYDLSVARRATSGALHAAARPSPLDAHSASP